MALSRARDRLREVQDEYEAYRLLSETLQEAQREESVHLGRVLGEPLAAQFQSLAGARYESLNVSTGLRTEGVVVAGATRDIDRLSVGTREQLATLFRLALARHVGSLVVLDDQLVQSDPARMAFFSRLLAEVAGSVQIVVFTCRATDYVARELLPAADGPAMCDHAGSGLRVIDLGRGLIQGA